MNRFIPQRKLTYSRKAPIPTGLLTGPRKPWRRCISQMCATVDRAVDRLPLGSWFRSLARRGLTFPRIDIPIRRGGPGLDGLTLAFLSDLHLGCSFGEVDCHRVFAQLAAEKPDLVCFGGDLINTREREINLLAGPLSRLAPPLGCYAVPGNHDYFFGRDIRGWQSVLEAHGVTTLVNSGCRIKRGGASLWLAGVDDLTEGEPSLPDALSGVADEEPVVLLSHHPDFFFEAAAVDVELTLAGHTHGGQICLGKRYPFKHSKFGYWEGLFTEEQARLYVSRGVGVTLFPFRYGAPPEIPILRLVSTP